MVSDDILLYNGTSGAFIEIFVEGSTQLLAGPLSLAFGTDNNLYVGSLLSSLVARYDVITKQFIDIFVPEGSGGLENPAGIVFGPDGNLYVSSFGSNEVLRYDGTTGEFMGAFVTSESGGLNGPFALVFGPDDNLYVISFGTTSVLRYNGITGEFINVFVPSGSGGLDSTTAGLVFGPDGNLYVGSEATDEVMKFNGTTGLIANASIKLQAHIDRNYLLPDNVALIHADLYANGARIGGTERTLFGLAAISGVANRTHLEKAVRRLESVPGNLDGKLLLVLASTDQLLAKPHGVYRDIEPMCFTV